MTQGKPLFLHLWLKLDNFSRHFIYRSYVSISPTFPKHWGGMTVSELDKFETQEIAWPSGVETIAE